MLTAKDLAKEFDISPSTMSLILNNKPGVGEKLRRKVLARIEELGCTYLLKNNALKNDKNNTTINHFSDSVSVSKYELYSTSVSDASQKNICFIVYHDSGELLGSTQNSFFPYIIDGIENRTRKNGYNLTYLNISRDNITEEIQLLRQSNCLGFIIFATEMRGDQIAPFMELGIPFVLLDTFYNELEVSSVIVNNRQGTYLAVEHLVKAGHKEIGYLSSGLDFTSFIERKKHAFKAMHAFDLTDMEEKYSFTIGYPDTDAYEGMKTLLAQNPQLPTAFLVDNDLVAVGAIRALKEAGYRIPEDISFVGFDDRSVCTIVEPQLTTIQIPRNSFGGESVELLLRLIDGTTECVVKTELNNKLIIRNSVFDRTKLD